jgi:hypothetical protein
VWTGRLPLPMVDGKELFARELLGVELGPDDVPLFAVKHDWCPVFLEASLWQFEGAGGRRRRARQLIPRDRT